jgi:hypothetical protein
MAYCEFLTTWCTDAPIERGYETIHDSKVLCTPPPSSC